MLLVLVLLTFIEICLGKENNVCPTYEDYYTMKNNSKCWYDFSAEYDVPSTIRLNGYAVEEYKVATRDGYILTLYRIPSQDPKAWSFPIYLQHGIQSTCAYFIGIKEKSLAFVLADAGYDVWLGNFRGSQYSEEHVNKTVYDQDYWDHSMDEIVEYDFPAIFHTVLSNTDPDGKIIYIGHSLGTALALMYSAQFPEIAGNTLQALILMSPAYTLSNMISPYKMAAPFGAAIMNMARRLRLERIVSQAEPLKQMVRTVCLESPPLMQLCIRMYDLFYGPRSLFTPDLIPIYFNHLPGGTALKILNHAADMVMGNFRKYNYVDPKINYKYYGQPTPPIYDIKKLQVPVFLYFSTKDWATTERDAMNLWNQLPERAKLGFRRINLPRFNHMDFVYSRQAGTIVYAHLLKLLNKIVNS